jgi:hypothetical protein
MEMSLRKNTGRVIAKVFPDSRAMTCLGLIGLLSCGGCASVDWSSLLTDALSSTTSTTTDATLDDLVGTWTGTLTASGTSQSTKFAVDSSGNLVVADNTSGTATVSTTGKVVFSFVSGSYTLAYQGTLSSDKTEIVMSIMSWSGTSSGSTTLSGTLTQADSGDEDYSLTDLVGTWTGTLAESGQSQTYAFTVDSSGNFTTTGGLSGTAVISTGGTVIFTYTSGGYTGSYQGTMNSGKTKIVMTTHLWIGTDSGSADCTGTLIES